MLCLALIATRRWHGRFTDDGVAGVQKFHKAPTPRVGGLALALAYWLLIPALPAGLRPVWALIGLAGLPALLAGLAEDLIRVVGVRFRLLATMGSGVAFALLTGYTMHEVDLPGVDWLLSFYLCALLFTGFAMGGVANAINIIDGFHGLAAGSLLIMLAAFAYVARQVGDDLVYALALLYGGLILGFFLVNFPFGKIFLGDGGAYFSGFLLAALGVLLPARNPEISAWTAILICAYPVIETLASMRPQGAARRPQRRPARPGALPHARPPPLRPPHRQDARGAAPAQPRNQPGDLGAAAADRRLHRHRLRKRARQRLLLLPDGGDLRRALPGDVAERAQPAARARPPPLIRVRETGSETPAVEACG